MRKVCAVSNFHEKSSLTICGHLSWRETPRIPCKVAHVLTAFLTEKGRNHGKFDILPFRTFSCFICIKVSIDVTSCVYTISPEKKRVSVQSCLFWDFGKFSPDFHPDPNATYLTVELLGEMGTPHRYPTLLSSIESGFLMFTKTICTVVTPQSGHCTS
jgi:hypothetical protein